jgi:hypothetical protein
MKTKKRKIAIKEASEILLLFKRISRSMLLADSVTLWAVKTALKHALTVNKSEASRT